MTKPHPPLGEVPQIRPGADERLDSWKEIARYLNRTVRTVQRWEETDGLPVHRLKNEQEKRSPVYAYTSEIDGWLRKNPPPQTEPVRARRNGRLWLPLASVAIVAAAALFLWLRQKPAQQMSELDPTRVAVAVFENRTGDSSLENLGLQIADAIKSAFAHVREVKVADSPPGSAVMDHRRLAEVTRSGMVVTGSYYLRNGQVELYAQVADPLGDKNPLYTFDPIPVSAKDPAQALDMLCQRVAGAVAFSLKPGNRWAKPPLLDAYREFELANLAWGNNYDAAYSHYEKALSIDPEFWMARYQMFAFLTEQGRFEQAETLLAPLEAGSGQMTPDERTGVRLCRAILEGHLPDTLIVARDLAAKVPDYRMFRLVQGVTEIAVNQPLDAIKTLQSIPVTWATASSGHGAWPSQYLAEAHHLAGDFAGQLQTAKERLAQFPDELALYSHQSMALAALGNLDEMDRVIDACLRIPPRKSSRSGNPATVMDDAAYELRAHGHGEKARDVGMREIAWLRARPQAELNRWLPQLGRAFYLTEQYPQAREIFKVLAGKAPKNIEFQGYLGALAARMGDRPEAERIAEALRAVDGRYRYGLHTYWRARIASLLGDKKEACKRLGEAFSQGYRFSISVHRDPDFEPLRDYPPYQELIRPKG